MPELPEVEISLRGITPWIVGNNILRTEVRNKHLRWLVSEEIITLRHQRVLSIKRRAKYLLLELKKGWIIIHLGMSGYLQVLSSSQLPEKHDHIDLIISNGRIIRYTDPRRFGSWLWSDDLRTNRVLACLGPEPLSDEFNGYWLYQNSRDKRISIKSWLMDSKVVVGIGNIYASESLFFAGIQPNRPTNSLSEEEAELLANNIKTVLLRSIDRGGTTLQNFLQPNGKPGYFFHELHVYGRDTQPCRVCGTAIQMVKISRRSSFFCPICQH